MIVATLIETFFTQYPGRTHAKGDVILRPGAHVDHVQFLASGSIIEYDISDTGSKIVVNTFKPGAFFPMAYILNKTKSPFFFEASTDAYIHAAPQADVMKFMHEHPEVTLDLLARLYRGVDGLLHRQVQLMSGSARDRLWQELTVAATRFGEKRLGGAVFIPITTEQLAQQTGLARETISRELSKLRSEGMATTTRGGVQVNVRDITEHA